VLLLFAPRLSKAEYYAAEKEFFEILKESTKNKLRFFFPPYSDVLKGALGGQGAAIGFRRV